MSKQQPTSFEATKSVLDRLFPLSGADAVAGEKATNAAVIFGAVITARAIDRLTKAMEANTAAIQDAAPPRVVSRPFKAPQGK